MEVIYFIGFSNTSNGLAVHLSVQNHFPWKLEFPSYLACSFNIRGSFRLSFLYFEVGDRSEILSFDANCWIRYEYSLVLYRS